MNLKYSSLRTSNLKLPYLEAKSNQVGPTIWLTGCIHGDEVGGMIVIHEIFKRLKKYPLLKGNLLALPLLNPTGFQNVNRNTTLGYEGLKESFDLNRVFPGKAQGSQAQKPSRENSERKILRGKNERNEKSAPQGSDAPQQAYAS